MVLHRLIEPAGQIGTLVGRPSLLGRWLLTAHAAQVTLALCFLLGLFAVPHATEAVAESVFRPQVKRAGFLGLKKVKRKNPRAEVLDAFLLAFWWAGTAAATSTLLWLHIPKVVQRPREQDDATARTMLAGNTGVTLPGASVTTTRNRYEVEAEIGRGGMGIVYRARDSVLDRVVALKELPAELKRDDALATRFRQEARLLARLAHPNIVQVFDLVDDESGMWMAMELVEGRSLAELLDERGALPVDALVALAVPMARAMAYAHASGVIHRDFKPDNVMLAEGSVPKVMDFGIAKLARQAPQLTQEGSILGSPAYMSPEQASGRKADASTDVYAFGVTLYEMATGATPFQGDTASVLSQHITQPPPPPTQHAPGLPAPLAALVLEMLAKEPSDRPADMEAVASRLESIAGRSIPSPLTGSSPSRVARSRARSTTEPVLALLDVSGQVHAQQVALIEPFEAQGQGFSAVALELLLGQEVVETPLGLLIAHRSPSRDIGCRRHPVPGLSLPSS
ncbi:MAG: serine/threonine protein kinase [Deltaproteobacteria bacterium]|nr:serine/threonine protein kinase [Deltaproteobacteria bacterium]